MPGRTPFTRTLDEYDHVLVCESRINYNKEPFVSSNLQWKNWFDRKKEEYKMNNECPFCWYVFMETLYCNEMSGSKNLKHEDAKRLEEARLKEIELKAEIAKLKVLKMKV